MTDSIESIFHEYEDYILSLEWVERVINKNYIAYKFDDSNFAEIEPQVNSFDLVLELPYSEIEEPVWLYQWHIRSRTSLYHDQPE